MPQHGRKPAVGCGGPSEDSVHAARLNNPRSKTFPAQTQDTVDERPLVDRHGHRYGETILRNWSPAALKALGIRRVGAAPADSAPLRKKARREACQSQ
jgi:hypothetical protein